MDQIEFQPRFCPICNGPKNELRDNVEIILRCTCDWERGYHDRIRKTIHYSFWREKVKNIKDWSPPIFQQGGPGRFKNFIKVQKGICIHKLYDFCFKYFGKDEFGHKTYALDKSIEKGRNLYIRGPNGSGRGLLMSQIKFHTAWRDISTTPLPGEWSTFKSDMAQCNWNGKEADDAKARVLDSYRNVKLLTLENVRGENSKFAFKGAIPLDDLLTKRSLMQGSMVLSSSDFIHQLGDAIGDRLPDILLSDNTTLILMFSAEEADALVGALVRRLTKLREQVLKAELGKKGVQNQYDEERILEMAQEVFIIENAFPKISLSNSLQGAQTKISEGDSLSYQIDMNPSRFHEKLRELWAAFNAAKQEKSLAYQEGLKKVYIAVMKDCPELGQKMSEKEMIETGKLMSFACSEPEKIKNLLIKSKELMDKMLSE